MPNQTGDRVQIVVEGLRELRRDLKAVDRSLPTKLNRELRKVAEPARREAMRLAPRSKINRPGYKHVADTIKVGARGSTLALYSRRTGAGIIHYGGRHPLFGDRTRWYPQRPTLFLPRAVARFAPQIERDAAATVERLMRDAGFK